MSQPIPLQTEFAGMFRDKSRDDLPKGKCWNLVDWIPERLGAPLRKRGGWDYFGNVLSVLDANAGTPTRVAVATYFGINHKTRHIFTDDGGMGGNFTITFRGQTTGNIAYNANAATIQAALEALSNVAPGDVSVSDNGLSGAEKIDVTIEWTGTYASQSQVGQLTINDAGLSGAYTITTSTLQVGGEGGTQVLVVDGRANPELFDVSNGADRGSIYGAAANPPMAPLVPYRSIVLIPSPAVTGSPTGPRKYTPSTGAIAALGGSPPGVRFFCIHKNRVVAASADSDTPSRLFFAGSATDAGDPETWDTTNRWMDTKGPAVALASLRNVLLVFHSGSVERVRGDVPPGSAAANMVLEPLFDNVGIHDAFSLAVDGDTAYWADKNGVYRSDGTELADLTAQGGMQSYWQDQFASVGQSGHIALAVWRNYLWISMCEEDDTFVDFLVWDIRKRYWFRLSNIRAYNFAVGYGADDELYFSNRDTSTLSVAKMSSIFSPSGNTLDAEGTVIAPVLETPIYNLGGLGKKRWKNIYLSYMLVGTNPNFSFGYTDNPNSIGHTGFDSMPVTLDELTRRRVPLGRSLAGLGLQLQQSNDSQDALIFALEADVHAQEGSRRGSSL